MVTRWRVDQWSRGSYSFVAVGASGSDYDVLAAPVHPQTPSPQDNPPVLPRLFFAGKSIKILQIQVTHYKLLIEFQKRLESIRLLTEITFKIKLPN